jgi:hypothetical protein
MKALLMLVPFILIFILTCGNNSEETVNNCYSKSASNPCFNSNVGGSTTTVTDKTTQEITTEQESQLGFKDELQITSIVKDRPLSVPSLPSLSVCEWEQRELVIKSDEEWSRFRDSCFFSSITGTPLPDIDFSSQMVLVSMQDMKGLGTQIEAVLEFSSDVVVVISDDVSSIPPPAPGFPFNVVSVIRKDLPVNFIRVKNLISP